MNPNLTIKSLHPWYQKFTIGKESTTAKGLMNDEFFDKILRLFPKNLANKLILDLACNAGLASFRLAGLGAKVIGFDKSEHYIDQANFIMKTLNKPKVFFVISDIENLMISNYSPDIVLLLSSIYHLKDPKAMIKKVCQEPTDIIISFRLSNYDQYMKIFKSYGRSSSGEVNYGRKRAVLFRQP